MNQRNNYLTLIKNNLKQCDLIVERLDEKGLDTNSTKILLSDLEQEVKDLNGKNRMRYSLDVYEDCLELSEFYLTSLKKRKRII